MVVLGRRARAASAAMGAPPLRSDADHRTASEQINRDTRRFPTREDISARSAPTRPSARVTAGSTNGVLLSGEGEPDQELVGHVSLSHAGIGSLRRGRVEETSVVGRPGTPAGEHRTAPHEKSGMSKASSAPRRRCPPQVGLQAAVNPQREPWAIEVRPLHPVAESAGFRRQSTLGGVRCQRALGELEVPI
jgi:hypothetical protein